MKRILLLALFFGVVFNGLKAQWLGSTTTEGDIYRDGNVGIGIEDPNEKLDVTGRIRSSLGVYATGISNPTLWGGNAIDISMSSSVGLLRSRDWTENQWLPIYFQASKCVFNNGNVGIGTINPNKLLELSAGYGSTIISLQRNNTNTTGTIGDIGFKNSEGHFVAAIGALGDGGNTGGELAFRTMTSSDKTNSFEVTERMRIDNDGNVGIGTTAPSEKLDVTGRIKSSLGIYTTGLYNPTAWEGDAIDISMSSSVGFLRSRDWTENQWLPIYFQASKYVFNNGNVGIGTINPNKLLELSASYGSTIISLQRNNTNTTGTIGDIGFKNSEGYFVAAIGALGDGGNTGGELAFRTMTSSDKTNSFEVTERMRIDNDGNVGIGIPNPENKLDVNGTIRATEVKVATGWADFVFESDYNLNSLEEVDTYIQQNGHLPEIPTAKEVEENGISLGEMNAKLLQKIEELTLYTIEQQKEIEELKRQNEQLNIQNQRIEEIEKTIEKLK